ncbi:hypothetical protein [Nocardiopsis baichengensis]|uniref:hypothetical protein n=1 Tax=Nocardiopsis baichengensis TaxID=280240 RepID=UPI00034B38BB|nr:hypothetical protein [Nocardiopsis baichengensis]
MDGDGASHLGRGRSWICVALMIAGFSGGGVALALGPAWVWVAVGAVVFLLGGCLAVAMGIMGDTVTDEQVIGGAPPKGDGGPERAVPEAGGDAAAGEAEEAQAAEAQAAEAQAAEAQAEELGRFCLAAIRREFGPPGASPEGDHLRWRVQDAVWRLRDLPPEEGDHEDARRSLEEVRLTCRSFGSRER